MEGAREPPMERQDGQHGQDGQDERVRVILCRGPSAPVLGPVHQPWQQGPCQAAGRQCWRWCWRRGPHCQTQQCLTQGMCMCWCCWGGGAVSMLELTCLWKMGTWSNRAARQLRQPEVVGQGAKAGALAPNEAPPTNPWRAPNLLSNASKTDCSPLAWCQTSWPGCMPRWCPGSSRGRWWTGSAWGVRVCLWVGRWVEGWPALPCPHCQPCCLLLMPPPLRPHPMQAPLSTLSAATQGWPQDPAPHLAVAGAGAVVEFAVHAACVRLGADLDANLQGGGWAGRPARVDSGQRACWVDLSGGTEGGCSWLQLTSALRSAAVGQAGWYWDTGTGLPIQSSTWAGEGRLVMAGGRASWAAERCEH